MILGGMFGSGWSWHIKQLGLWAAESLLLDFLSCVEVGLPISSGQWLAVQRLATTFTGCEQFPVAHLHSWHCPVTHVKMSSGETCFQMEQTIWIRKGCLVHMLVISATEEQETISIQRLGKYGKLDFTPDCSLPYIQWQAKKKKSVLWAL